MKIKSFRAREILASNSEMTIELELETEKGVVRASAPVGTSRGKYEAVPIPMQDAMRKISIVRRSFTGNEFFEMNEVDGEIKRIGGPALADIGGNVSLAISSAFLKAFALNQGQQVYEYLSEKTKSEMKIPFPICNVAGGWGRQSDIQEFLLMPAHQESFAESISKISGAYRKFGDALKEEDRNFTYGRNPESGWSTRLHFERILSLLKKVADGNLLRIGLDVAASHLWKDSAYVYSTGEKLSSHEQLSLMEDIARKYPVSYIEDPFHEDDFLSFSVLTQRIQPRIVCGDDLYATDKNRLIFGAERKATSAITIKPNQVGTITDAIQTVNEAKKRGIITVVSHRSNETEDNLISHLAVGLGCDYAKIGIAGERIAKINEIIRIEEEIEEKVRGVLLNKS